MPMTDKDVADLCVGIYAYPGVPPVAWDRLDDGEDGDQICWGVKVVDGGDVVVFRGSTTSRIGVATSMRGPIPSAMPKSARSIPAFCSGSIECFRSTGKRRAANC